MKKNKWYYKYRGNGYGGFDHPYLCVRDMFRKNRFNDACVLFFGKIVVKDSKLVSGTHLEATRTLYMHDFERLESNYNAMIARGKNEKRL